MEGENISTIKMLTNHMVNVKLEYEGIFKYKNKIEEIFELNNANKILKNENNELNSKLQELYDIIHNLKMQIMDLKHDSAIKSRLDERNEWQALVDAIQTDRKRLEIENDNLKSDLENKNQIIARFRATNDIGFVEVFFLI